MSYATESAKSGRQPIALVELDLDRCSLSYGTAPCGAGIGVTGTTYCYNTRATCQSPATYAPEIHTYRYCTARMRMPVDIDAIPSVKSVDLAATKLEIAGGLGARANVQVTIQDHPHHDRGTDPYWRQRYGSGAAQEAASLAADGAGNTLAVDGAGNTLQVRPARPAGPTVAADGTGLPGTYWGRMRARNVHYLNRVCRIKTGYLGLAESDWIVRTYALESISGPDAKGLVALKAKDPLKLADDERAQAPRPGTGSLVSDIDESATTIEIVPASAFAEFEPTGYLRIGDEVCTYTLDASPNITIVRGQASTSADSHESGETVQPCLRIGGQSVSSVLQTLLADYAAVPVEYLDIAGWEAEEDEYLPSLYSTLIVEPTPVKKLVKEFCQSGPLSIWWDERAALVKIRALRAPLTQSVLDETDHLLKDSISINDKPDKRISQQWVFMSQRDPTESLEKASNWRQLIVNADLDAESTLEFGVPAIAKLYSRWIVTRSVGEQIAAILVQQFGDIPREIKFSLDARTAANYWTGDIARISSRQIQDADGNNLVLSVLITQADESQAGHRVDYVATAFNALAYQPTGNLIVISESEYDVDLYALYIVRRGEVPTASTVVTFVVEPNVIIGQSDQLAAMVTGTWPIGAQVRLENSGRMQGYGGRGGDDNLGANGTDGGNALHVTSAIMIANYGELWGGGGGDPDNRATAGGDPGENGERNGQANTRNYEPGIAGYYIIGNDLVTWEVEGDRRGRVL